MIERTSVIQGIQPGRYTLQVLNRPEKKKTAKSSYRVWDLGIVEDKVVTSKFKVFMFPWESEGLLLALGGKKDGNDIVWDDEEVTGKQIDADVKQVEYEKDGEKRNKYVIENCAEAIPF